MSNYTCACALKITEVVASVPQLFLKNLRAMHKKITCRATSAFDIFNRLRKCHIEFTRLFITDYFIFGM